MVNYHCNAGKTAKKEEVGENIAETATMALRRKISKLRNTCLTFGQIKYTM